VITTKAVLRFSPKGEAYLHSYHPGTTMEDVLVNTGWDLEISPEVRETEPPTRQELRAIRSYDRNGFWTK
jgi:glutaconate CoA-transferase subunit B